MEWLLLGAALMVFILVPIGMMYDMFNNPAQFGISGPCSHELPGYKHDAYDFFIEVFISLTIVTVEILLLTLVIMPFKLVTAIPVWFAKKSWYLITGDFMAKDRWFEAYQK